MSWDITIQRFSRVYDTVEEIPGTERCVPIGSQDAVRAIISRHFPGTDWSDPRWGVFGSPSGSIEFNTGTDEPSTGFMMHVRASSGIIGAIIEMCKAQEWQALDCSSGAFLERSPNLGASLEQWIGYRNRIARRGDA